MRPPTMAKACWRPMRAAIKIGMGSSGKIQKPKAKVRLVPYHAISWAYSARVKAEPSASLTFGVKVHLLAVLLTGAGNLRDAHAVVVIAIAMTEENVVKSHGGGLDGMVQLKQQPRDLLPMNAKTVRCNSFLEKIACSQMSKCRGNFGKLNYSMVDSRQRMRGEDQSSC